MSAKPFSTLLLTTHLALAILLALSGCSPNWEAAVVAPDGAEVQVNAAFLQDLAEYADEKRGVPLERVLWSAGHDAIERLVVATPQGEQRAYNWAEVAEDSWWDKKGRLVIGGETMSVSRLETEPPPLLARVEAGIADLAPTAAAALGIPAPAGATGHALVDQPAGRVLLLFLDGFGYLRYTESRDEGLIPTLAALEEPRVALAEYPPCTRVGTGALLTGATSRASGIDRRDVRQTELETLFDVAAAEGLRAAAVEGESLAFNLRSTELQLSGDRDGNGSTDDNVLANALALLDAGMPDLLLVHFHGIDDAGHTYGPGAPKEKEVIRQVDAAVGQILDALPQDTLVLIFADHGMHPVQEEGRLGNHGNLIARDMLIPIFITHKD